ncbi:hypothetical protein GOP47_0007619 [Adiantum capillus-veneris]|uniref:Uncharacterized protein n=1 Tax=Adiantum capillus-veneris TaxID=13818 RepID=A0A9D4V1M3_ADICA|nr:hypothetical protein GOP47_0007619 [Adiantum capillus-veneris]
MAHLLAPCEVRISLQWATFAQRPRGGHPLYDRQRGDVAVDGGWYHPDNTHLVEFLYVERERLVVVWRK